MSVLKVSEAFCYICRGVLIEPVTLPCSHVFCYTCFDQSMLETSHSCPLCRKRISNWIRSAKKSNNLIDAELWEKIQKQFKEQILLKTNGEDDGLDQSMQLESEVVIPTSKPGEVGKEFKKLIDNFQSERNKLLEAEELASKKLIEKLKEEDEKNILQMKQKNMIRVREDEKLAKIMQEEMKKENPKSSKHNIQELKTQKGPIDDFINNLTYLRERKPLKTDGVSKVKDESTRSNSCNSNDSIHLEINLFKPIKTVLRTPPKRCPDGKLKEVNLTKVTPLKLTFNNLNTNYSLRSSLGIKNIHSSNSAFVDANTTQNVEDYMPSQCKYPKLTNKDSESVLKDITTGENSDNNFVSLTESTKNKFLPENTTVPPSNHFFNRTENGENNNFETQDYLNPDSGISDKIIQEQLRIEQIILQEKKDKELALRLKEEWESEARKPQTRSMLANSVKKKKISLKDGKTQKTLEESISNKRKTKYQKK